MRTDSSDRSEPLTDKLSEQTTQGPMNGTASSGFTERTAWVRSLQTPLRQFLRTEASSAALLLGAVVAALAWANIDHGAYEGLWRTRLSIRIGGSGISQDLRHWINNGLMTFFFLVVGLELRREFDVGELRERMRLTLPVLAGLGGMALPALIFLAFNAGKPSAHAWGAAISTDTAFALGILAWIGSRFPARLRVYLLTITVLDDVVALAVIVLVYSGQIDLLPLVIAVAVFAVVVTLVMLRIRGGPLYFLLGVATWVPLYESGIDPIVLGLAIGLIAWAYPLGRDQLETATDLFRRFREQPTPELARSARAGVRAAVPPNERLQEIYHSWTSYVIVPLFALANAGIAINGDFLSSAYSSPVTLGILLGYVLGKPGGIGAMSLLVTRLSRARLRPPVGWAAVAGGGTIAGVGFTVSILVASIALQGADLREGKLGVLSAVVVAPLLTWLIVRITAMMPRRTRLRALFGTSPSIVDLAVPVDPERDHIRGPSEGAPVTLVEYGDFECPYCGRAEPIVREVLSEFADIRYVWRHLPLTDVHPNAQLAAQATEAADRQEAFWEMHDLLLERQGDLRWRDLLGYAEQLGLDVDRFRNDIHDDGVARRIAGDVDSADQSGVTGTPTFFINGRRHQGAYDIETLSRAVKAAGARSLIAT
jgi:Na+/H+ antiporter NhaA